MRYTDNEVDQKLKNCNIKLYYNLVVAKIKSQAKVGLMPKSCVFHDKKFYDQVMGPYFYNNKDYNKIINKIDCQIHKKKLNRIYNKI